LRHKETKKSTTLHQKVVHLVMAKKNSSNNPVRSIQTSVVVEGTEIRMVSEGEADYIALTDIAKRENPRPESVIQNWLRNRSTVEYLGLWESLQNPRFNHTEFDVIRSKTGLPAFTLSVKDWTTQTQAIGIRASAGRYGGTYAHRDIAMEFCSWLSPAFKLYLIREFERLKTDESVRQNLDWSVKRMLTKANYIFHTEAVRTHLIPPSLANTARQGIIYASEAELLNRALFGITSKEWREENPNLKGNLRDYASVEQLLVLANIENLNAQFIKMGLTAAERLSELNNVAIEQMTLLLTRAQQMLTLPAKPKK
jgi:KilA-N domain